MAASPMSARRFEDRVLRILSANRVLALATVRPDGWPQVTLVGYIHEGLTLYCSVASSSQKRRNIARDGRVSVAVGRRIGRGDNMQGLSMAAHAEAIDDPDDITRINQLLWEHLPDLDLFAPRAVPATLLRLRPEVISLLDTRHGAAQPVQMSALLMTGG